MFSAFNTFGRLGAAAGSKSLAQQIAAMSPSLWLEPSVTNGYQDSAGTTALTQPGAGSADPPVGLALDLSQGAQLGPELVTNGDFSNGTTGWTAARSAVLSVVSGKLQIQNNGETYGQAYQVLTTVVGATYKLSGEFFAGTTPNTRIMAGNSVGNAASIGVNFSGDSGAVSYYFVATTTTTYITIQVNTTNLTQYIAADNLSVKLFKGNHATQSTSTARPKLSARVNLLTYTEDFTNGAWITNEVTATATTITTTVAGGQPSVRQGFAAVSGTSYTYKITLRAGTKDSARVGINLSGWGADADTSVEIISGPGSITRNSGSYYNVSALSSSADTVVAVHRTMTSSGTAYAFAYVGTGAGVIGESIGVTKAQVELGSTATTYQRVTDANTYDSAGFPLIHQFDGVDDVLNVTFPSSLGSDCTVVTANRGTTPTILTGQTIGTSYTINTTNAGRLVFPRALTAAETAIVTTWATKKGALPA